MDILEIIKKAKKQILISTNSDFNKYYDAEKLENALSAAQKRGVKISFLFGPETSPGDDIIFLGRKHRATKNPKVSFIVLDSKHVVFQGKSRTNDRVSGKYLRDKFQEAIQIVG